MAEKEYSVMEDINRAWIRWGVPIMGMLLVAGAASLATRNVYSKQQVNEKIAIERQWSDASDKAIMEASKASDQAILAAIEIQSKSLDQRLMLIREDQQEIKQMIRKKDR